MAIGSSRVTVGGCTWELLAEFKRDITELNLDHMTLHEVKRLMLRAAQGTVRTDEWEYPLVSGGNMVGELRLDIEELKYRLYYNEPRSAPTLLLAVLLGVKTHDEVGHWKSVQQGHIQAAKLRLFHAEWY
ncbi:hypothetical protein [Rhodococcus sp. NPDC060084]|uniref:hypothetical protein n=1 Tax=Rhodococcus sp. NPDC060084 TaxID=3347053 RepID=UPI00364D9780